MDVDQPLDEDQLNAPGDRLRDDVRKSVWRKPGPSGSAKIEVPRAGVRAVVDRARPERADLSALVSPGADEPSGPARVGLNPRVAYLIRRVARLGKGSRRPGSIRNDTQTAAFNRGGRNSATLQVRSCARSSVARQFGLADGEVVGQELGAPVALDWALKRRSVDTSSCSELLDNPREIVTARRSPTVQVRGPEHRLRPVDEKAARRWTVRNYARGAGAESAVRHLLVRRDPAASVAPPTELRESCVEALGERRQDDIRVEVHDRLPPVRAFHRLETFPREEALERGRRDLGLSEAKLRSGDP